MRDLTELNSLSDATFYDRINIIYQFIKPFSDNKMSMFEEYGAFNLRLAITCLLLFLVAHVLLLTFRIVQNNELSF